MARSVRPGILLVHDCLLEPVMTGEVCPAGASFTAGHRSRDFDPRGHGRATHSTAKTTEGARQLDTPDTKKDSASVRRQAAAGGLKFEAYLPPRLAEWVISLVEQEVFHSPAEAVFVAMQSFRELEDHPEVKQALLASMIQKGIDSMEEGGGMPTEEVMARLRKKLEGPRAEPAVWDKSLDRPLFPEDCAD
jgi:antitoxin ParD1/3/4